eukprot:scaffold24040_cov56-Attheya_sp.AAC.1
MDSDEVGTFEVFDHLVLSSDGTDTDLLIDDVTLSVTHRSPPGTSGGRGVALMGWYLRFIVGLSMSCELCVQLIQSWLPEIGMPDSVATVMLCWAIGLPVKIWGSASGGMGVGPVGMACGWGMWVTGWTASRSSTDTGSSGSRMGTLGGLVDLGGWTGSGGEMTGVGNVGLGAGIVGGVSSQSNNLGRSLPWDDLLEDFG